MEFILPSTQLIIAVVALSAVVSWGLVQVVKSLLNGLEKRGVLKQDDFWHRPLCRLLSIVIGFVVGWFIADLSGALIGAGAGGLNTMVVALVKDFLKKKASAITEKKE